METKLNPSPLSLILFFIIFNSPSASQSSPQLRGLHPLDAKYFEPEEIKCKDGSNSFTRDRVNDDFCDCVDGTDEPGTSACANGKFYCRNLGSTPHFLFSSRVNDHICDCCDGSDEYDGGINCPNTCIRGGNINYRTEHRRVIGSSNAARTKESNPHGNFDVVQNFKDWKLLVIIQLFVIFYLLASLLFYQRMKSRRRRHH